MKNRIPWKLLLPFCVIIFIYIILLQASTPDISSYIYYENYFILDFLLTFSLGLSFFIRRKQQQKILLVKIVSYGLLIFSFLLAYYPTSFLIPNHYEIGSGFDTILYQFAFVIFAGMAAVGIEFFFYLVHRWLLISQRSVTLNLTQTISFIVLIIPSGLVVIGLIFNMFINRDSPTYSNIQPVTYPGKFFTSIATQLIPVTGISIGTGILSVILASPFVVFFAWIVAKYFTKRLQTLVQSVHELKIGNLGNRVIIEGEDEISRLMGDFNEMAAALEQSQHELVQKQEKISALLASQKEWLLKISHELRTPVSTIKAVLESSPAGTVDEMKQKTLILQQEVDGLHRLIEDLFTLTQSEHAQLSLQMETLNIPEDIQPMLEPLRQFAWGQKQIELASSLDIPPLIILADRMRLAQILRNLTQNAVRHTETGGLISIETANEDDRFILTFKDTGEGIPAEMLENIWDPFEKHPRSDGAGIGLTLVKQLVEMMGGNIIAISEPGCGACFKLCFPVAK
jgi:signal transduction histidine kinase